MLPLRRRVMLLAVLAAVSAAAVAVRALPRGRRIAVVAFRDSRFMTVCPVLGKDVVVSTWIESRGADDADKVFVFHPPGSSTTQRITLMPHRGSSSFGVMLPLPWTANSEASAANPTDGAVLLDRPAPDPDARQAIEEEFRKQKRFTLADSPENADYVFVVETTHIPLAAWGSPQPSKAGDERGAKDKRPAEQVGDHPAAGFVARRGDPSSAVLQQEPYSSVPPSVTIVSGRGDLIPNFRQTALAVVVPSREYLRNSTSAAALISARVWAGLAFAAGGKLAPTPASLADLVGQFHSGKSPFLRQLPLCALPSMTDDVGGREPALPEAPDVPAPALSTTGAIFRSLVTLVRVPVLVSDELGRPIADLDPSSFHVFEDGKEQRIDRVLPATAGADMAIVLDTSSSMRTEGVELRRAAVRLLDALPPDDRAMVVTFDDKIRIRAELTANKEPLRRAVSTLPIGQATRLYDAVHLVLADRMSGKDARRTAVVLFTDGLDTASRVVDREAALRTADASNAVVYVVRYDTSGDKPIGFMGVRTTVPPPPQSGAQWLVAPAEIGERELEAADQFVAKLATSTGGWFYSAGKTSVPPEIFFRVASELSQQYMLCYYSTNDRLDGTYRRLAVSMDRPGCTVRARAGYRAVEGK